MGSFKSNCEKSNRISGVIDYLYVIDFYIVIDCHRVIVNLLKNLLFITKDAYCQAFYNIRIENQALFAWRYVKLVVESLIIDHMHLFEQNLKAN